MALTARADVGVFGGPGRYAVLADTFYDGGPPDHLAFADPHRGPVTQEEVFPQLERNADVVHRVLFRAIESLVLASR